MHTKRIILFAILLSVISLMAYAQDQFTQITVGEIVTDIGVSQGVCWIDYDSDNYLDVFVVNLDEENCLYRNNGDGSFSKQGEPIITANENNSTMAADWGDINNDGYPDVCIATSHPQFSEPNRPYLNNGDGSFTAINEGALVGDIGLSIDLSWIDYNNDGSLDLYIANYGGPNFLYRQDDTGFTKVDAAPIGTDIANSSGVSCADYDNDGDLDIFVPNTNGNQLDHLYENNGDGSFTRIVSGDVVTATNNSTSASWGDYDNDGDLDLFVASFVWGAPTISFDNLYQNIGGGILIATSDIALTNYGAYSFSSAWGDYDNDGNLDLMVANDGPNLLYRNLGDGTFEKVIIGGVVTDDHMSGGAAWGDYDRDGDLDLFVANNGVNDLYRNDGNINNWINIKCIGTASNYSAIGAKVRLKATINDNPIWQLREISSKTGTGSQNSLNSHFGLGDASIIDTIKIEWPSGMVDIYTDVAVNQFITYTETTCGDANGNFSVNLLDITYLISYLYKGGPDPVHMQAADPDGNGTTNILDITYLIAYLYKGGTKPVC